MNATTVSHLHPAGSFDVADHLVPSGREEVWRFTPLARLAGCFEPDGAQVAPITAAGSPELRELAVGESPRGTVLVPVDRPAAIAAGVAAAPYVRITEVLDEPVLLTVGWDSGDGSGCPTLSHLVIEATPHASATVVLTHTGTARYIGNVEAVVGEGAELTIVSIQEWDDSAIHLGQHEALVHPGGRYRHIAVSLGGGVVRLQNNVSYAGVGGEAELLGVYFARAGQHLEHRLFIDHNRPKGTSRVDYRGALAGEKARSVWVGDVLIRPEAEGISTYESNKNLILTDGCRADAVPNLEIETGQIAGAGHSASTGRFDEEQLFYLESRGLDPAEARRLVVHGFFAAILAQIGLESVSDRLMARLDAALDEARP